jgi:glycosyltransferase involved in cell wall biosynthesis
MSDYKRNQRIGWLSRLPLPGNPKISMIVAAYDRPRHILVCLNSLIVQTHDNIEIIVVHDGPGSRVREAVARIDDPRIRYYETGTRAGPMHQGHQSREYGSQLATGDWIGHTNDDNYYAPVYCEWMLSELLRNDADFAYCNMIHSHYSWQPFDTTPLPCRIDAGGWICKASIVKRTPWRNKTCETADGEYASELAQQSKVVKVPGCIFVHN